MSAASPTPNGWSLMKRVTHWGAAIAVVLALLSPKPEDGEGLLHIIFGTAAAALIVVRLLQRLFGDVKPRIRDALNLRMPAFERLGLRALAPPAAQIGRLIGFVFLAAIPLAATLGVLGLASGEESALLEAHEALGSLLVVLIVAHVAFALLFTALARYDLLGVTLLRPGPVSEGGARGAAGLALGAATAAAAMFYLWGPYDIASRAAGLDGGGEHGGEEGGEREYGGDDDD